jgi:hypothetical protein
MRRIDLTMPKTNRTPDNELMERYKIVQDLIVKGFTGADIARYIADKTDWGLSTRQAYNYYNDAFAALADESNVNRAAYFKLALDRLQWLYMRAIAANDLKLARKVTMDLIAFLKLDTPSADFDWQEYARNSGLDPSTMLDMMKRLTTPQIEVIAVTEDTKAGSNGHG